MLIRIDSLLWLALPDVEIIPNSLINEIGEIIKEDADVIDENGNYIIRFRKNALTSSDQFKTQVYSHAKSRWTNNRSSICGGKYSERRRIYSSIIGYMDAYGIKLREKAKRAGIKLNLEVRESYFQKKYQKKFEQLTPLIKEIDLVYKNLMESKWTIQRKMISNMPISLSDTVFTTLTLNYNVHTSIHKDIGDFKEGFGNLTVLGKTHIGGETCFPRYDFGVDVREGDILLMNVHEWHCNLPIIFGERISVICYLREKLIERTSGLSKEEIEKHFAFISEL